MTATDPATARDVHGDSDTSWERQLGEGARAYGAFRTYLELGPPRTLGKTARLLDRSLSLVKRWSARHHWRERAAAYDDDQRRHQEEAACSARDDVYQRREAYAEQLERVAMAGLRSLMVRDAETGEIRFDRRLKPTEIAALIRVACRLLPTSVLESADGAQGDPAPEELARLTSEDVEMLLSLLERPAQDQTQAEKAIDEDAD